MTQMRYMLHTVCVLMWEVVLGVAQECTVVGVQVGMPVVWAVGVILWVVVVRP
jgi:hypothetical protein